MTWFKAGLLAPFALVYKLGKDASEFIDANPGSDTWHFAAGLFVWGLIVVVMALGQSQPKKDRR